MTLRRAMSRREPGRRRRGPAWAWTTGTILNRTTRSVFANNAGEWAAAMAYDSLLSLFPLLLVAGSIAALVVDPRWAVERVTPVLGGMLPQGSDLVERIVEQAIASRGQISVVSGITLVWTASRVFSALTLALNAVCDDDDPRDAPRRVIVSALLLTGIAAVFLLALLAGVIVDQLWDWLRFIPGDRGVLFGIVRHTTRAASLIGAYFLIYRFVPRGTRERRAALVGALTATALVLLAQPLFLLFLQRSRTYQLIYGPLATAATLMVWAWVVAFITLIAGQLAYHERALRMRGSVADQCEPSRAAGLRSAEVSR